MLLLRWFTGRSLRFQVLAVLVLTLSGPTLLILYNQTFAAASQRQEREERRERLSLVTSQLAANWQALLSTGAPPAGASLQQLAARAVLPVQAAYPGIRMGFYFPAAGEGMALGTLFPRERSRPPIEAMRLTDGEYKLLQSAGAKGPRDWIEGAGHRRVLFYTRPVPDGAKVVAWAEESLLPSYPGRRPWLAVTMLALAGLLLGMAGAIVLTGNLVRGFLRIRQGLAVLQDDLTARLPALPGELGQVTSAINRMAEALQEKERLEEELRRSERLAALGHLVAGLAHEMRNPLGIIRATAQVMAEEYREEGLQEDVRVILEQADRQNRVIEELLAFARPAPPLWQEVNVNDLLQSVLAFSRSYLRQQQVELVTRLAPALPPVRADGERLKQVFLNLILNAAQAMPGGGRLEIESGQRGDRVECSFRDSGEGIDAANLPHIFDPFYTTRRQGVGLGLSISHRIVEMHEGQLGVEDNPGGGAVFTVSLPATGGEGGNAAANPDRG